MPPDTDPAAAPLHPDGAGDVPGAGHAAGRRPRVRLDRHPPEARRRADQRELRARVLGLGGGGDRQAHPREPERPWSEVIGVVADIRHDGVDRPAPSTVYWPQRGNRSVTFMLRGPRAGTDSFATEIRRAVAAVSAQPAGHADADDAGGLRQVDGADRLHADAARASAAAWPCCSPRSASTR